MYPMGIRTTKQVGYWMYWIPNKDDRLRSVRRNAGCIGLIGLLARKRKEKTAGVECLQPISQ